MSNTFSIRFEFGEADAAASRIESALRGAQFRREAAAAVDAVTVRFNEKQQRAQVAGINLSPAYVKGRTAVTLAPASGPVRAEILTLGKLTVMGHYPWRTVWAPAGPSRSSAARGTARGGPSKGDAARGVPPGRKAAGVRVDITRGAPSFTPKWFTMALRRGTDSGDRIGVFYRAPGGRAQHRYAVSPYSLFRHQVELGAEGVADDLESEGLARMGQALQRAI